MVLTHPPSFLTSGLKLLVLEPPALQVGCQKEADRVKLVVSYSLYHSSWAYQRHSQCNNITYCTSEPS